MNAIQHAFGLYLGGCLLPLTALAQYRADFEEPSHGLAPNNLPGWYAAKGDGDVLFRQRIAEGSVSLVIDPLHEKRNIWYAFAHQDIAEHLDLEQLGQPGYELRMEARVMPSHAPRRINMYLFAAYPGGHLREFDLAEADTWHTISMTTRDFVAPPGGRVMAQVSLMDWGNTDVYELKVDYITVDVVKADESHEQFGEPLEYRPPLKEASHYAASIVPSDDAIVDAAFPAETLGGWENQSKSDSSSVLQVDQTKTILLRWDFSEFAGKRVTEAGQLELSTESLFRRKSSPKDFGEIRFQEIRDSAGAWDEATVTYDSFLGGQAIDEVVVSQCIIDTEVNAQAGGKTVVTISRPVLQRLVDGTSAGIAITPLGLISASFHDRQHPTLAPRLRFNVE